MASSSSNPYHPPSDLDALQSDDSGPQEPIEGWPIGFAGKLGVQDADAWTDLGNKKSLSDWFRYALVAVVVVVGPATFWVQMAQREIHLWPIIYLLAGLFLLQPYHDACEWWKRRQHAKASLQLLQRARPCQGGFDQGGGYWQNEDFAIKFSWDTVSWATLGPGAMNLTFWGMDWYTYLPTRFFKSSLDFHRLSVFLHQRYIRDPETLPSLKQIEAEEFHDPDLTQEAIPTEAELAAVLKRTIDDDPFRSDGASVSQEDRLVVRWVPAENMSLIDRLKTLPSQFRYLVTHYLPVHLAMVAWLMADRIYFGDWGFVLSQEGSLLIWGFYLFSLGRGAVAVVASYRGHMRQQMQELQLVYTPESVGCIQGDSLTWTRLSPRMRLVSNASEIGWEIPGSQDPGFLWKRKYLTEAEASKLEQILVKAFSA